MDKKLEVPTINEDLIKYLNILFPEQCADLNDTEKTIFYKSGQRSVVKHLIEKFKQQQET